ncbi:MAG: chorismate synthase [Elusimicrobiota bacterium]
MKYLTAGDSHGKFLVAILDGFPYGVRITPQYIANELKRRRECPGRGIRQKSETDKFEIISGVKNGITTGMPIGILIENSNPSQIQPHSYFTPTHSELAGMIKYSHYNAEIIKERSSARETAARVAIFSFTKRFIELLGIKVESKVISCYGENDNKKFESIIKNFEERGLSFGGVFEIRVKNFPAGVGGFSQGEDRISSKLASAILTIGSIKGIEFGDGFKLSQKEVTEVIKHPAVLGGIEAGITDGNDIIIRAATRPLASIKKEVISYDLKTKKKLKLSSQTSDITSVFAAAIICEHVVSYTLANEIMLKFGNENFNEIKRAFNIWKRQTLKKLQNIKR